MTPRVLTVAPLLSFVFLLVASLAPAVDHQIHDGVLTPDQYHWVAGADGHYRLELDGGRPLGVTDEADLPALDLLLLVPSDLPIVDVRIEPVVVQKESLPGRLAVCEPLGGSSGGYLERHHLAADGVSFPTTWGQFGGLHTWRGYRLMAVNLHPFRVVNDPDGSHLEVLTEYVVHAVLDPNGTVDQPLQRERLVYGERKALESMLRQMVVNPEWVGGYGRQDGIDLDRGGSPFLPTPSPALDGSAVRYLIVTTEELEPEFQRLAADRTAKGLPGLVVTREWIAAHYRRGTDFQETMRFFLQDAYTKWGMEYLLIGADTNLIPTRIIRSGFYPYDGHTDVPTDLYFAGLDGDWAADGDGWYGEPYVSLADPGDNADFAPEIAVGRAPVRDIAGAQQFVDKILEYESTPAGAPWANRVLFAAEVLFPADWSTGVPITLDGAQYAHTLINDVFEPCTDMEYIRMYETDQLFPRDAVLSRAALIDSLNTGHYGQFNQFGHGHYFNMSVADANFTVADAGALHNPNYFMMFAINCASGAFDLSCLLERFVSNPNGGSIISIGAAREAFPSNSFGYQAAAYDYMSCQNNQRITDSINLTRVYYAANAERNTVDRWTQLNLAVIGDPVVGIWSGEPRVPDVELPATVAVGEQTLTFTILDAGAPAVGADVCLYKGDETYAFGVTDAAGQIHLTVIPETAGDLTLTVSGVNLELTSWVIPVTASVTYLSLASVTIEDGLGNSNGRIESGELVSLVLDFDDVGGGGAVGLSVTISSSDEDLMILDGTAALDDCLPGGSTSTIDDLVVKASTAVRDGTMIPLRVEVSDSGEETWVSVTTLDVCGPELQVIRLELDDGPYGDNDGVPEDGERLVLRPWVKNYGSGQVDYLIAQVINPAAGVTVHGGTGVIPAIDMLEEMTIGTGELSVTLDDVNMSNPCGLSFSDNYGRTIQQLMEIGVVPAPDIPTADATVAPDAIALRWDPVVDATVMGYNVYRADAAEGPFVKANTDLIYTMSYFEDRGLEQLTYYWFQITAVDSFLVESAASPAVLQGTMAGEIENFPLPFNLQTSGSLAVGDIDGDGELEIVLVADEVYVWNPDGSELLDGDNNAQTTGPLTDLAGVVEFGPSGVTLADLDGIDGLEIIVSELSPNHQLHAYNADGTMLPGWPLVMQSSWNWAAPSVGDVDGDGDLEIVVNDLGGRTFVWHHDGTELLDGDNDPATIGVFLDRPDGWGYSSPAIHDLDGDGACEMIWGTRVWTGDNALLAYSADGTQVRGFPFELGYANVLCSPAIADLDWDGEDEIIFFTTHHDLYVLRSDGTLYPGFPTHYDSVTDDSFGPSPGVGNFDGDVDLEIVWPVNAGLERMDLLVVDTGVGDGTAGDIMPGWPVELPANTEGSPVVGDLDGDGLADIVQPIGNSETETPDLIMAFSSSGEVLPGFPIPLSGHCRATPFICDIEGDGDVDLLYGSWDNLLHVWDLPAAYDPAAVPWPTLQGNAQRDGVARQLSITAVEPNVPLAFTVLPPHPNPFNPTTSIKLYVVPGADTHVDVSVFDLRGRRVRQLMAGDAQPGWLDLTWDGHDDSGRGQASGVYFVRARQASNSKVFKMTLVK